jgi:hypothetical protein
MTKWLSLTGLLLLLSSSSSLSAAAAAAAVAAVAYVCHQETVNRKTMSTDVAK